MAKGCGHFTKPVKVAKKGPSNRGPSKPRPASGLKQSRLNTAYGITKRKR